MQEVPGYFRSADGTPLYGVYHQANSPSKIQNPKSKIAVLLAPPLFEERKSAYATLNGLARALAQAGHPVLRFDFRGSGESGGAPGARRWSDLAADLAAGHTALRALACCDQAALVGLRLGATLCMLEAERSHAQALVALAPVVNGAAQTRAWRLRSKIRSELTAGAAVRPSRADETALDLDGFAVHPDFISDVEALDLPKFPEPLSCPGLLLQLSHRTEPSAEYRALAGRLGPRCTLACLRLEAFWDRVDDVPIEDLQRAVQRFLEDF